ncbi:hypothetical protein BD410DRAFT_822347 [Rickenella mellea]|uniref:GST N-terminal domain-containing protein n=1 Tax=Rickenella mellea TaxID=50990 RepID=A0A4Y7PVV7_9AGAM|nr:hypothetical protein BD410DRAFT_822347 [Rickenella mellea]
MFGLGRVNQHFTRRIKASNSLKTPLRTMITLYDIPCTLGDDHPRSPNVWKTRVALKYKGLQYKTEWVAFPDIKPLMQKLGAPPSAKSRSGTEFYTVPVIYDSTTGHYIADSFKIAQYLDTTYPSTPPLFPAGADVVASFEKHFIRETVSPLIPLMVPRVITHLQPRCTEFFRTTREQRFKCTIEEIAPDGSEKRKEGWEKVRKSLDTFAGCLTENGALGPYLFGEAPTQADFIVLGWLLWIKTLSPEEWEPISHANGGRWGDLVHATEKYQEFS